MIQRLIPNNYFKIGNTQTCCTGHPCCAEQEEIIYLTQTERNSQAIFLGMNACILRLENYQYHKNIINLVVCRREKMIFLCCTGQIDPSTLFLG